MDCILCGKKLEKDEDDFCRSCIDFLKHKYPRDKNFERRLKCYKEIVEELQEE